jgi:hypothetical protein
MGATFEQRYGTSLGGLVDELLAGELRVNAPVAEEEGIDELNTALDDAIALGSGTARWMARVLHGRLLGASHSPSAADGAGDSGASDVVVLASGNLGLISFTRMEERLTYEQLETMFPRLLTGLVEHPGISFIMARSRTEGGLVLADGGIYYLDRGYASGRDPLAGFGPNAAAHLRRTDRFPNAPDVLVMSMLDGTSGEVAAFEELVGCHGGLGGPQTLPFVLYPSDLPLDPERDIVGAAALHDVLVSWVAHLADGHQEVSEGVASGGRSSPGAG